MRAMDTTNNTRQRLIDSAQQLFHARSYHAVGVNEICELAGVNKGSFYHFFASKRDLTLAVLDATAQFYEKDVFSRAFEADISPLARIERFFNAVHEYHQQIKDKTGNVQGCPFSNLASEMSTQDESLREKAESIFRLAEQSIEQALDDAVACHELPDIDTTEAAQAIFAYTQGLTLCAKTRNDTDIIRNLGKRAIQLAKAAS